MFSRSAYITIDNNTKKTQSFTRKKDKTKRGNKNERIYGKQDQRRRAY